MSARARQRDREIIDRYTDQPIRLPAGLRADIERCTAGKPVELYALCDLDPALRLVEGWLALGPDQVAIARPQDGGGYAIDLIDRARIRAVRETPGLTCHVLSLLGAPDEPPLAQVRYTHRQRRAVDVIRGVLDQTSTAAAPAQPADDLYADAVAAPIRILDEATSSVDTETERAIEEAIHRLIRGRTVFAIAHRLSTLRRATRLFVIEDGKLTESGSHGELMSNPTSTYRRLVDLQREVQHAI
jgi:hypothetical protein